MTALPGASFLGGTNYNKGVFRNAGSPSGGEPLVPTPVSSQIIQELPTQSVALDLMRRVTMSSATTRQPVLDTLPTAYFLNSDYDLKQTTQQRWKNSILTAEELAVIVPIPLAYLQDADVDLWAEIRPRIVSALGLAIDQAVLFGVNKPSTWGTDIYTGAVAASNTVTATTPSGASGPDLAKAITDAGRSLKKQGFSANGFIAAPGFSWEVAGWRSTQGVPIYQPNTDGTPGGNLYGLKTREVMSGAFDDKKASLLMGQWDNAIIGVRQDITFEVFTEGVITDNSNPPAIVLNLMQQDSAALRCVMRVAYQVANPVTEVATNRSRSQFPFAVIAGIQDLS